MSVGGVLCGPIKADTDQCEADPSLILLNRLYHAIDYAYKHWPDRHKQWAISRRDFDLLWSKQKKHIQIWSRRQYVTDDSDRSQCYSYEFGCLHIMGCAFTDKLTKDTWLLVGDPPGKTSEEPWVRIRPRDMLIEFTPNDPVFVQDYSVLINESMDFKDRSFKRP
jgi:hypothetical protein